MPLNATNPRSTEPPIWGPSMTPGRGGSEDMVDDSIRSRHSNGSPASGGPNDPLAELARLIGQNDPFADFGRDTIRGIRDDERAAGQRVEPRFESAAQDTYQADADEGAHDESYAVHDGDDDSLQREEIYDDPPQARRRSGLVTVMAVAGLAVLGTAGAFGYRTISGPSGPTAPPPVIRADTTPSKIVPAVAANEQQSNKLIQDRVGSQGERIVSREEQPIEIRDARPARSVFPPAGAPGSTASVPASPWPASPTAAPQPAPASAAASEPKKVRTVAIRPDQQDASARPAAAPAPPRPSGNATAPISLNPQNTAPEAPAAGQRPQRTATAPNPPAQPAALASGSYVQVSSQRSETDAQSSFKALQGKYPAVLGGKQAVIRRAELGDKGVYYRAMVGPFASIEQATELCTSLKAAGGQCIVQRN